MELSELFPELWRTARGVEGWLRKNPLDPSRRWFRAPVRHGADARAAIAAVLGVAAEQIGAATSTSFDQPSARPSITASSLTRRALFTPLASRPCATRRNKWFRKVHERSAPRNLRRPSGGR